MPTFAMFDGSSDPYDHMLHYNKAMTLNVRNDHLLCKVFSASLQDSTLVWFHRLPRNSVNSFSELWTIFISQYICSVRKKKRNISSLQTIIRQKEETIQEFIKRFGKAVQHLKFYSMDAVLQNFRKSFESSTPFFHSLALDPSTTMEELYRREDKYSTLEDNIHAATQTVMITSKLVGNS